MDCTDTMHYRDLTEPKAFAMASYPPIHNNEWVLHTRPFQTVKAQPPFLKLIGQQNFIRMHISTSNSLQFWDLIRASPEHLTRICWNIILESLLV